MNSFFTKEKLMFIEEVKKYCPINYNTFRINMGENFPGSSSCLSNVLKCNINELNNNYISSNDIDLCVKQLNNLYNKNYGIN